MSDAAQSGKAYTPQTIFSNLTFMRTTPMSCRSLHHLNPSLSSQIFNFVHTVISAHSTHLNSPSIWKPSIESLSRTMCSSPFVICFKVDHTADTAAKPSMDLQAFEPISFQSLTLMRPGRLLWQTKLSSALWQLRDTGQTYGPMTSCLVNSDNAVWFATTMRHLPSVFQSISIVNIQQHGRQHSCT